MPEFITPIFIVGVGRSGTSLLQSMLNAHSTITCLPETQFFRQYVVSSKQSKKLAQQDQASLKTIIQKDKRFSRLQIPVEELFENAKHKNTFFDVYQEILKIYLNKHQAKFVVDKDPKNLEELTTIENYFPDAIILHIYRDPRDVVLSKTKAKWSSNRPYWLHALIGEMQLSNGRGMGEKMFNNNFIEIKYENLISDPQAQLEIVCDALELDFEESMLNFETAAKVLVASSEMQWKKETLGPLLSNNMEKWKKGFSTSRISAIELCSPHAFTNFDYQPSQKVNIFKKTYWGVVRKIFRLLYSFKN